MKQRQSIFMIILLSILFSACTKDLKEIIADTKSATFIIYTFDEFGSPLGSGSGFFIEESGIGITNYHVLDEAIKAVLKTDTGEEYEIDKVITSDKKWDVIKFSIKNPSQKKFHYLKFADKGVEQGDKVYNISAPLGLEQTVSEGIVSSLRQDSHGDIIQITAPISPGSSGSAILNEKGEVIAVATFGRTGGQALNFGVAINEEKLAALTENSFVKTNPQFNQKEEFLILNIRPDNSKDIILNALEFKKDVTIAYLSFTNLNISQGAYYIWCELNKGDKGFLIHDKESNRKYYLTSSTIGINKANGTEVPLASTHRFKVFFPPIKDNEKLKKIDVVYGYDSSGWQFTDIDLDKYRSELYYDTENYQKEYGYAMMHEGNIDAATNIFMQILENSPEDEQALNVLGIISYAIDNNSDAEAYFTKSIEAHPNSTTGYINRCSIYRSQKNYSKALADINQVIGIDNAQPDNYVIRAFLYMDIEEWKKAKENWDIAIATDDFKKDDVAYYYRSICHIYLQDFQNARKDIEVAYNLTNDPEMEKELQELYSKL